MRWLARVAAPVAELAGQLRHPLERPRDARRAKPPAHLEPVAAIAAHVHLSEGTVRNHLSSAIGKTGATTRSEAARIAQDRGWL